jgi:UDP-2,3-diacylglucosamine hydrolase
MSHCLFVSDVHLCESRPQITQAFVNFLDTTAMSAQAVYILGDLFEYWAGDDAISIGIHHNVVEALKRLVSHGVAIYLLHGNRDFLLGDDFAISTGIKILSDPSLITLYKKSVLISHGDELCTDDVDYQNFRREVRCDSWKKSFLAQPLDMRIKTIEQLRRKSEQEKSTKSMQIMDVNSDAVKALIIQYDFPQILIHGHTHRPNMHLLNFNGHICERWVLGDWYEQGSYIQLDSGGCHAYAL